MSKKKINEHYDKQARMHGTSPKSTMPDLFIRKLEVEKIKTILKTISKNNKVNRVLEVGCGNGYTLNKFDKAFPFPFYGIDYNQKMINLAKKRKTKKVIFKKQDILNLDFTSLSFDLVFTERCLINLESWKKQKLALNEICRVLKKGGHFILLEAFTDGLDELNNARKSIGLEPIPPAWHNFYLNKKILEKFFKNKFVNWPNSKTRIEYDNFLSSYYFGSRVLYPALIKEKKIIYNNSFVKFFSFFPNYGNYSPIQVCVIKKT